MLQRIQTVYLAIAFILFIVMFRFPIVELITAGSEYYVLLYRAIVNPDTGAIYLKAYPLAFLILFIAIIAITAIFVYKKRVLQMRLIIFNIVLMLGSLVLIWYYSFQADKSLNATVNISFPVLFPIVSIILYILAYGAIRKDENLVRSIDRIR